MDGWRSRRPRRARCIAQRVIGFDLRQTARAARWSRSRFLTPPIRTSSRCSEWMALFDSIRCLTDDWPRSANFALPLVSDCQPFLGYLAKPPPSRSGFLSAVKRCGEDFETVVRSPDGEVLAGGPSKQGFSEHVVTISRTKDRHSLPLAGKLASSWASGCGPWRTTAFCGARPRRFLG